MKQFHFLSLAILYLILPPIAMPEGFQPFEAGAYPIASRIEAIKNIITATHQRLENSDLSSEESELRNQCLLEYLKEKEQLEIEYEEGKRISRLPGIMYLTRKAEIDCLQGLTIPSSG